MMNQLAVLIAALSIISLAIHARPPNILDDELAEQNLITEDDIVNSPDSEEVLGGDEYLIRPPVTDHNNDFVWQVEDMMFVSENDTDSEFKAERNKRNAVRTLWVNGIIPYEITSAFDECERRTILQSMRHWEEKTCIRFRRRTSSDADYVRIITGQPGVCRSYVGRIRRSSQPQALILGEGCVRFSLVVHELGHAIGFWHEHNRVDRNQYITVFQNNVQPTISLANFDIENGDTLGLGYDYASIMHYSSRAFSRNYSRLDTMRANSPNIPIGGAEELSPLDILKAQRLYSCSCPLSSPTTVVPSSCREMRPASVSCGTVENVAGGQSRTVSSPGYPAHRHNQRCAWVFTCPSGYVPRIRFPRGLGLEQSTGCSKDYVQVYYRAGLLSANLARFSGFTEGRICESRHGSYYFTTSTQTVTIYYRTDGYGSGSSGLQVRVTCVDKNECESFNRCHTCTNTISSFACGCRGGYYFSKPASTCYDINECAYQNGGCSYRCVNRGGSYRCECPSGQYLRTDGKNCGQTRSGFVRQPIAPVLPASCFVPVCPALNFNHGTVIISSTSPGGIATYSCNSGYTVSRSSTRICQSNGVWSGSQPFCQLIQCPPLTSLTNGGAYGVIFGATVGDRVTFFCNSGYTLSGSSTRTCQSNGTMWSGSQPSCQLTQCPVLVGPSNGGVSAFGRSVGAKALYFCNSGYTRSESSIRTCQSNGTWSGTASTCNRDIPQIVFKLNGRTYPNDSNIQMSDIGEGDNAALLCVTDSTDCCTSKTRLVGEFYYPDGRRVNVRGSGDSLYRNRGEGYIRLNRKNNVSSPLGRYCCEIPDSTGAIRRAYINITIVEDPVSTCPTLSNPANGTVSAPTRTVGSVARYSCSSGYILNGGATRTCQFNGVWSGSQPSCLLIQCPPLVRPFYVRVSAFGRSVGAKANYSCYSGQYTLSGSSTRTCQSNGTWSGSLPSCQMTQCPVLVGPSNGEAIAFGGRSVGAKALYFCNSGYTRSGSSTRTCQSNGTWSGSQPSCQMTQCPALVGPSNGGVSAFGGRSVGAKALYFCNSGYTRSGSSTRTCQSNGVWSGTAPTCLLQGFYLRNQFYPNGSLIRIIGIGEGDTAALIFRTDHPNCCKTQRLGECYYPNGNPVGVRASGNELYRNRGEQFIRLNRQAPSSSRRGSTVTGLYCCVVPDTGNSPQRVCVNITL